MQQKKLRLLGDVASPYQGAVRNLQAAMVGTHGGRQVAGAERLQLFEDALAAISPVF